IAAVGGIIYGSIKYTMSGDSEQKARDAKVFIFNVIAGVVAYGVGYAIINFLIPGGLVPF
ncbi:hypothetical protein HGB24_03540, partial [Candidatus Saccharibacteria bacterium]|nr:hypothetical protein [Candidatus Saccharibacteria bacterium]